MKLFPTDETTPRASKRSRWLWFFGLYGASFVVVGGLMLLAHWLGTVLSLIA